jgi:N-carbamoylputrescine amidase
MPEKITVGAAQITTVPEDIEANLETHLELIAQARAQGCDLLVFPELSLTGYTLSDQSFRLARSRHSKVIRQIAEASQDLTTQFGFIEEGPAAQYYNATLAVRDGEIHHLHRKVNLPSYGNLDENKHFATGRFMETANLDDTWRYAILICADAWNPALVHLAAMNGATLLSVPISSSINAVAGEFSNPNGWDLAVRFYAMMYGMPVVMTNRVGTEGSNHFWGGSAIIDAHGRIVTQAGDEATLLTAELDYSQVREARFHLPTVRDSNFALIQREVNRLSEVLGIPESVRE